MISFAGGTGDEVLEGIVPVKLYNRRAGVSMTLLGVSVIGVVPVTEVVEGSIVEGGIGEGF
jgi:hypothetical protein